MIAPYLVAIGALAIGVAFIAYGVEICQHHCWLDAAVDWLVPAELDRASGGLPWIVIGVVLLVVLLRGR